MVVIVVIIVVNIKVVSSRHSILRYDCLVVIAVVEVIIIIDIVVV